MLAEKGESQVFSLLINKGSERGESAGSSTILRRWRHFNVPQQKSKNRLPESDSWHSGSCCNWNVFQTGFFAFRFSGAAADKVQQQRGFHMAGFPTNFPAPNPWKGLLPPTLGYKGFFFFFYCTRLLLNPYTIEVAGSLNFQFSFFLKVKLLASFIIVLEGWGLEIF